ncbi:MAG: phosphomannomutase/phosphoglucomutase [Gammaproteobacteria bacterium]
MNKNIFREYDIRGVYPIDLNEDVYFEIGNAIASKCKQLNIESIVIGRDGRLSGKSLMNALENSLINNGINVENIGIVTSPLLYYAAKKHTSKSGIMVTGSHNPKEYNGIKMIINDEPVSGKEIFELIGTPNNVTIKGTSSANEDVIDNYIKEVKSKSIQSKDEIKVVIDCGNGAAGVIAPKLFSALGFNVVEIYSEVDGSFPNHHPDPGNPENLKDLSDKVLSEKANIGLAFDGDGDRLGVVDNKGKIIPQDKFLMLLAKDILKNSPQAKIIFDVKCTNRLKDVILGYGGEPIMSPTGHFHIKKMLRKTGAHLAGEMSGHIFFNDDWYGFDDAHYSGFRLIKILIENESELAELLGEFPDGFTTPEINLDVDEDKKFQIVDEFKKSASFENASISMLDGLRVEYEDGWGLLRASNTTPKLVLRFEGTSQKSLDGIIRKFDEEFQKVHPNLDKIIDQI